MNYAIFTRQNNIGGVLVSECVNNTSSEYPELSGLHDGDLPIKRMLLSELEQMIPELKQLLSEIQDTERMLREFGHDNLTIEDVF